MKELREKLIQLGADHTKLYLRNDDEMYVNCADTQLVQKKDGIFSFSTVGGSRYFYLEKFTDVDECAAFIMNFYKKSSEQIDQEYRLIAGALSR